MNVEVALLSKLLQSGEFSTVIDKQISQKYFSGKYKKAFKFIQDHQLKYGSIPSRQIFQKKFRDIDLIEDVEESIDYWCDELRNKKKHNLIVDNMEKIAEKINELDTEEAYSQIKRLVLQIENEIIISDRLEINKATQKRLDSYMRRSKSGGIVGIPTGFKRLDYILKGFNPGELITLLGYTGTGKTWMEVIWAVNQAKMGYRVLFMTTEMSTELIMRRIDAVWNKFSYTKFRDGRLSLEELKKYEKYLAEMEGNEDFNLIVEQATGGISQVAAKIDQHKPDVVYIDGAYLLEDEEKGEDDWRGLVRIWRGLHRLVLLKKVPIVASTQSKEKRITLSSISFAKAISNDSDVVLALEQDEQQFYDREIRLVSLKIREGELGGAIILNWDFNRMDWSEIYSEDVEETEEIEEENIEKKSPFLNKKLRKKVVIKRKDNK